MEWGSTKPGEIFTGSTHWQAQVKKDRFFLSLDGQPKISVHLLQLKSLQVSSGVMWAKCQFDFQRGNELLRRSVDGIPNEQAVQMQRAVAEATIATLATYVSQATPALESWLDQLIARLNPKQGVIVGQIDIERALASVDPPPTPGKIPWLSILSHEHAKNSQKKATSWPSWSGTPAEELGKRVHSHNENAFKGAVDRWLASTTFQIGLGRWISKGTPSKLIAQYPAPEWPGKTWKQAVGESTPQATLKKLFDTENARHLAKQQLARKKFFDTVEKNPLTNEQIHACVCMDESVMVVAAAGSGKTSTMVAKTGYALHEGLATPEQILLLAFNVATAKEVGERIAEQLCDVPDVDQVKSKTFHAFGIEVIAAATGKKPSLAPWVDPSKPGGDIREVADIVLSLSAKDSGFKRNWDMFRTVYGRDVGKWGDRQEPDAYANGKLGFLTAKGEIVKSKEERIISDWLFYNGINYEYERPYEHDTANKHHRQYIPDFYYPDIKLYHEHFALNANGEAPKDFKGYLEGVEWKRNLHSEMETALFETTSHGLMSGKAIEELEQALVARGVQPLFDPNRPVQGLPPVPDKDLARTFRVFQQHVKNNGLTHRHLHKALETQAKDGYEARLRIFLYLYEQISQEWERRLREGKYVDFEDMLIQAAEHVESKRYTSPYTIILADEFQDSSRARIRLLKALAQNQDRPTHLCVVGDDWQGINRFAGSDISVMTEFEKTFEHATSLTLNTTFRCPQELCDVSSEFVQANPAQIQKSVETTNPLTRTPMLAYGFTLKEAIPPYIETQLAEMYRFASEGRLSPSKGRHITIMLLGRYRDDEPRELDSWKSKFGDLLNIDYKTAHGSKGLEAEYVFILNVIQGTRGFPSQIQDDPALQMAMPAPDPFPFAEERRLFYVAMTRARKQVRFYTVLGQPSQFLVELATNEHLKIEPVDGESLEPCSQCGSGVLQLRSSQYGAFHGCSRFPACDFKRKLPRQNGAKPQKSEAQSQRIRVPVKAGDKCPACRQGVIEIRNGRNGVFLGCSRFPKCKATANARS